MGEYELVSRNKIQEERRERKLGSHAAEKRRRKAGEEFIKGCSKSEKNAGNNRRRIRKPKEYSAYAVSK